LVSQLAEAVHRSSGGRRTNCRYVNRIDLSIDRSIQQHQQTLTNTNTLTQVEIRNAQAKPMAGTKLLLLDNGYFSETSLALPEVRLMPACCVLYVGRGQGLGMSVRVSMVATATSNPPILNTPHRNSTPNRSAPGRR
jgi:hypothetical protein